MKYYRSILLAGLTLLMAACAPDASINNEVNSESVAEEASAAPPDANPDELAGQWVGGFSFSSDEVITEPYISLIFEVDEDSNLLKGEVSILLRLDKRKISIEGLELTGALVSFNVNEFEFMGTLDGIKLTGEVRRGTEVGEFSMIRTETLDDAQRSAVIGSYVFDSGEVVDIVRGPGWLGYNSELLISSQQSGELKALFPVYTDSFIVGPGQGTAYPFQAEIALGNDGEHITRTELDDGLSETAIRHEIRAEDVTYPGEGDISIAATLYLPDGPGPFPAIVMTHGSGRITRDLFWHQINASFFARNGVAVLIYDKRGVGESGGTYSDSADERRLELLAQDAVAGVVYLLTRGEIHPERIGVHGISQAGWINPLAASQWSDIAFFINISGPAVSTGEESAFSRYAGDGEGGEIADINELNQRIASVSPSGYDPLPILQDLTTPSLWIFGADDLSIPAAKSIANLEALQAAGRSNYTVIIYEDAGHSLRHNPGGLIIGNSLSAGYVEDFFNVQLVWLEEQGFLQ